METLPYAPEAQQLLKPSEYAPYSAFGEESAQLYGERAADMRTFYQGAAEQSLLTGVFLNQEHGLLAQAFRRGEVTMDQFTAGTEKLLLEMAVTDRAGLRAAQEAQYAALAEFHQNGEIENFTGYKLLSERQAQNPEGVDRAVPVVYPGINTVAMAEQYAANHQQANHYSLAA